MNHELFKQLSRISSNGIISYDYIHMIIELINDKGQQYRDDLKQILQMGLVAQGNQEAELTHEVLFTAYYALGFYYKRYDQLDNLFNLFKKYGTYFEDDLLSKEVESWYYRRIGNLKRALLLDRQMMEAVSINVNACPYISFASSVGKLLEIDFDNQLSAKPLENWKSVDEMKKDWEQALDAIRGAMEEYQAIRNGKHYGKHYAIEGRLLMYSPELVHKSMEQVDTELDRAMKSLNLAIQYENEKEEDYYKRYSEYCHYQQKCNMIRMRMLTQNHNAEMQNKLEELNLSKEKLQKTIEENKAKEIELITIFTAIISIILGGVQLSSEISLIEGELLLITLASICLLLLSVMISLTFEGKKKTMAIVLSILLLIILGGLVAVSLWVYMNPVMVAN